MAWWVVAAWYPGPCAVKLLKGGKLHGRPCHVCRGTHHCMRCMCVHTGAVSPTLQSLSLRRMLVSHLLHVYPFTSCMVTGLPAGNVRCQLKCCYDGAVCLVVRRCFATHRRWSQTLAAAVLPWCLPGVPCSPRSAAGWRGNVCVLKCSCRRRPSFVLISVSCWFDAVTRRLFETVSKSPQAVPRPARLVQQTPLQPGAAVQCRHLP
jgi:hypothetical protein